MASSDRSSREPRSLEAWESWVDRLIVEAQERGEFDDLPGHGKPLHLEDAPFANGLEVGFGVLKNAGVAPYWIELEKAIREQTTRLDEILARARHLARERPELPAAEPVRKMTTRRWWSLRRGRERSSREPFPVAERAAREIARLRRAFLAAERERLIGQYNAAIPRELWHLEQARHSPEHLSCLFDAAVGEASDPPPQESDP